MSEIRPFSAYVRDGMHVRGLSGDVPPAPLRGIEAEEACARRFARIRRILAETPPETLDGERRGLIRPMLESLGWFPLPGRTWRVRGGMIRPAWTLFADRAAFEACRDADPEACRAVPDGAVALVETWAAPDMRRAGAALSPRMRLLGRMGLAGLDLGFLVSGAEWILVDGRTSASGRGFLRVDLAGIVRDGDFDAFRRFCGLFHRGFLVAPEPGGESPHGILLREDARRRAALAEDLRRAICGADGGFPLLEEVDRALLAAAGGRIDPESLRRAHEGGIRIVFRLLFAACLEARRGSLPEAGASRAEPSLRGIRRHLRTAPPDAFTGWALLRTLLADPGGSGSRVSPFHDEGESMLLQDGVMDNASLKAVLSALPLFDGDGDAIRRDMADLSAAELGAIYEGILDLELRAAPEHSPRLAGGGNGRKATASFYTPPALALALARGAADHQLERLPEGGSLLDLRILDAACGAGGLLVACLDVLTRRALERLELGCDGPLAEALEAETGALEAAHTGPHGSGHPDGVAVLRRLLLRTGIRGVDIQPAAAEVTRLSLWLETWDAGMPPAGIGRHVRTGNALIGAGIAELVREISPAAGFDPAGELRAIRGREISEDAAPAQERVNGLLNLLCHRDMLRAEGRAEEADALDIGQAARRLAEGRDPEPAAAAAAGSARYGFLNFEAAFPGVFAEGGPRGFHVIVGNPPWDKTKFADPAFFSQYRPDYRMLSDSARAAVRKALLARPDIRERYDDQKAWMAAVAAYHAEKFPECAGVGDGDLCRLFVARCLRLLAEGGTLACIVPTALLTDDGSAALRRHILDRHALLSFDGMVNRRGIFPAVHRSWKFGILRVARERAAGPPMVRFGLEDPADLASDAGRFACSREDLAALSGDRMAFVELQGGGEDLPLLRAVHARFPAMNPDWLDFRNELHSTADKDIFLESDGDGRLPLLKGACLWQHDSRHAPPAGWLDAAQFDARVRPREISRLRRDLLRAASGGKDGSARKIRAFLAGCSEERLAGFVVPDRMFFRLAFRHVSGASNERTLVCALLPRNVGAQDSLYLCIPKRCRLDAARGMVVVEETPVERMLFAQAVLNSIPADWVLRFSATMNVTKSILMRQPVPQPADAELAENPVFRELIRNALLLSIRHDREGFEELRARFGVAEADIPAGAEEADRLRIRNDVLAAGLYGLSGADMGRILKGFPVLCGKHPAYVEALLRAMA